MHANPLWRQFFSQRGYPRSMPETPPRNTFRNLVRLSQYNDYKRLTKYPLDTAFSEKALIIDIYGESGEASRGTSVESRG
jgi:hypothetical protein